jgi:hypothetical protein
MDPKLARVTEPGYIAGITALPIDQVRARRTECQIIENALSYARRVAQGRLDLVGAELARRRAGGDPSDLHDLVDRLPDILAERAVGAGLPRPPLDLSTEQEAAEYVAEIDAILSPARFGSVTELADAELEAVRDRLEEYERSTSEGRHQIHTIIDALQGEIARRYRTGEATVDSLLQ